MKFTTYGSAITSLVSSIKVAQRNSYDNHYSTPCFFKEEQLATHIAFESWCYEHGIAPEDMNNLRVALTTHAKQYNMSKYRRLSYLETALPDEFNVRGVWTPR